MVKVDKGLKWLGCGVFVACLLVGYAASPLSVELLTPKPETTGWAPFVFPLDVGSATLEGDGAVLITLPPSTQDVRAAEPLQSTVSITILVTTSPRNLRLFTLTEATVDIDNATSPVLPASSGTLAVTLRNFTSSNSTIAGTQGVPIEFLDAGPLGGTVNLSLALGNGTAVSRSFSLSFQRLSVEPQGALSRADLATTWAAGISLSGGAFLVLCLLMARRRTEAPGSGPAGTA
jgi:hypothetical protein